MAILTYTDMHFSTFSTIFYMYLTEALILSV